MRLLSEITKAHGQGRNDVGVDTITARLVSHPDTDQALRGLSAMVEATWGQAADPDLVSRERMFEAWENCLKKKELPAALEGHVYTFVVDGITRTCTHQLVRTRIGAAFGQQSQRANDISDFNVRIPKQIMETNNPDLIESVEELIQQSRNLYDDLIDHGIPPQEARFFVPEGTETHITCQYNTLALQGIMFRRLAAVMQWEIQWVARLMRDEVMRIHPWVAATMVPPGEITGKYWNEEPMMPDVSELMVQCINDGGSYEDLDEFGEIDKLNGNKYWYCAKVNPAFEWTKWDAMRVQLQKGNPGMVFPLSQFPTIENAVPKYSGVMDEISI